MRRFLPPLLLVLALGAGFAAWWLQPERVVARRVAGLFQAATVEADAGNLTRGTRGNALEGLLAPRVLIEGPEDATADYNGPQSRSTLVSLYGYAAKECRRISFEKPVIDRIELHGDQAAVSARVDAVVELPGGRRPADGIQHLTMDWREIDGTWRLGSIRWHESAR
jgi:hypothetical protein